MVARVSPQMHFLCEQRLGMSVEYCGSHLHGSERRRNRRQYNQTQTGTEMSQTSSHAPFSFFLSVKLSITRAQLAHVHCRSKVCFERNEYFSSAGMYTLNKLPKLKKMEVISYINIFKLRNLKFE